MTKVAVVTGASRGAGKGIAQALGAAGMTVYVTGRSVNPADAPYGGTVGETAALVTEAGGTGIAVAVDHRDDQSVADLFDRIRRDHGKLDILVNNAASVFVPDTIPFWERPLDTSLLDVGLRSHFIASYHAAPLLIANGKGLIVNTGSHAAVCYYRGGPVYGAQKAGADKMAADMGKELRPYNVAAVSIWMGFIDTESARAYYESLPPEKRYLSQQRESPQFTGRVIATLYDSDRLMELSSRALIVAELGAALGVADIDGTTPVFDRYKWGGPPELHSSFLA